jgi:predicted nucleic acid-binding Zn ribbon protein
VSAEKRRSHHPEAGHETPDTLLSTGSGGKPQEAVDEPSTDPVRAALAGAQGIARGKPVKQGKSARRRLREENMRGRERGGYSGAHPDDTDPQPLGRVLTGYVEARGWQRPLNEARVFSDWAGIVGSDVAAHCTPVALREGELKVTAESTAWATQLRLLTSTLLARLAAEVGPDVVHRIHVVGPSAPTWKHGPFSVRGSRGPRDTYG